MLAANHVLLAPPQFLPRRAVEEADANGEGEALVDARRPTGQELRLAQASQVPRERGGRGRVVRPGVWGVGIARLLLEELAPY
jgi:hypothetical protein